MFLCHGDSPGSGGRLKLRPFDETSTGRTENVQRPCPDQTRWTSVPTLTSLDPGRVQPQIVLEFKSLT